VSCDEHRDSFSIVLGTFTRIGSYRSCDGYGNSSIVLIAAVIVGMVRYTLGKV